MIYKDKCAEIYILSLAATYGVTEALQGSSMPGLPPTTLLT